MDKKGKAWYGGNAFFFKPKIKQHRIRLNFSKFFMELFEPDTPNFLGKNKSASYFDKYHDQLSLITPSMCEQYLIMAIWSQISLPSNLHVDSWHLQFLLIRFDVASV